MPTYNNYFSDNDEFLCKDYPCDDKSTTCVVEQNVRYCVCKPNFLNTLGSAIACQSNCFKASMFTDTIKQI